MRGVVAGRRPSKTHERDASRLDLYLAQVHKLDGTLTFLNASIFSLSASEPNVMGGRDEEDVVDLSCLSPLFGPTNMFLCGQVDYYMLLCMANMLPDSVEGVGRSL